MVCYPTLSSFPLPFCFFFYGVRLPLDFFDLDDLKRFIVFIVKYHFISVKYFIIVIVKYCLPLLLITAQSSSLWGLARFDVLWNS